MELSTQGDNTQTAAEAYIREGYKPVPVPRGEKGPKIPNWEKGGFEPKDFSPAGNIGLILDRSGLTEVDFDCD